MKVKNRIFQIISILLCGIILWYLYESILFSKVIIKEISAVIYRIINVVFPSLFGFMVISDFLVRTNLYQSLAIVFTPLSRFVFRMSPKLVVVFLLSCIGGYPVGIKLLSQLSQNCSISKKTAERMAAFCYMPSPSFTVGIIGISLYSSIEAGIIIYISCLISSVLTAIIFSLKYKFEFTSKDNKISFSSQSLVNSVSSSGISMMKMCGVIIFFSYIMTVLDCLGFYDIIRLKNSSQFLKSVFEITNISNFSADYRLLPLVTFLTSLGGISILLQVLAVNDNYLNLKSFFVFRIPVAILSGIVSFIILEIFPMYKECITGVYFQKSDSKFNFLSLICLFFMIIIIFFQKKNCNSEKSML